MRVTRSRELVAEGHSHSAVARVAQISRQAIYRVPKTRPTRAGRSAAARLRGRRGDRRVAEANQTDGYRMVCALVSRKLCRAVNRKRVLRVMRERRLIQRRRRLDRRRRPGFFQVTRPDELGTGRWGRLGRSGSRVWSAPSWPPSGAGPAALRAPPAGRRTRAARASVPREGAY